MIQRFFKSTNGLGDDRLDEILGSLGTAITEEIDSFLTVGSSESHEASKAFSRFISGDRAFLTVCEEEGHKNKIFFAALRSGKKISYVDLSDGEIKVELGTFAQIKEALKQAQALNDDIFFEIAVEG